MDRIDAMHAFVKVVETGSFTKAADALHISRTTATQLIQQLEAHLRVSLLHRTTRKITLTQAGSHYYAQVVQWLDGLQRIEGNLPHLQGSPTGRLRIDVPAPLASMVLVPALADFFARYPGIELHMGVSDRIVNLLDEGIDCVVRGGPIDDQSLTAIKLGHLQLAAYAAPAYIDRHGMPKHPRDLEGPAHRMVGFLWEYRNQPQPYAMHRQTGPAGQAPEVQQVHGQYALALNDGNAYLAAAQAGLGVALLPQYMAREALAAGGLQPVLADWQVAPMPMHIAFHRTKHHNALLRAFIDWLTELLQGIR